ncbi:MAG: hypothetical protein MUF01_04060 [Bryobacterales bacterium]|nr:hypothetical protein [Bryobacterales bacterium]
MLFYILVGVVTLVWLVLSWFLPVWFGLEGTGMWVLRIGLAVIGVLAALLVVLLRYKKQQEAKANQAAQVQQGGPGPNELIAVVQEAEKRLAASQSAKGQKMSELPLYFVMGEAGSTKTSLLVHSGLEPELLSGQVYQETNIIPTRLANFWFARGAVFAEVAGHVLQNPTTWVKFIQRLKPGRASKAVGGGEQAPRAAILCVNSEIFLQPNAQDQLAALSRHMHERLLEIARTLSIRFPVYVLFTKVDRVAYFAEYVGHLSNEEAGQVVGATLPYVDTSNMGVYAEEQTRRVSDSFNRLFRSVADKRPMLIRREPQSPLQANVYEFPREFRKVQNALVSFLVDLCRPSQLSVGPFLRGYYFCGVRPVFITDVVSQPKQAQQQMDFSEATSMFNAAQMQQAMQQMQAPKATGPRRVPQWVFVTQFFNRILLGDQNALRASSTSTGNNVGLRVVYASLAAVLLLYGTFLTISFFKNRALENEVVMAVRQLPATPTLGGQLATLDQLQRLEQVRAALDELTRHQREGKPLLMRWGIYAGDKLYPLARTAYFQKFDQLLLGGTKQNMVQHLSSRMGEPDAEGFRYTYDSLKSYLITTSHADKSKENQSFLPPVLMDRWQGNQQLDADRTDLARRQFEFYTRELQFGSPYPTTNDENAIDRARTYLLNSQPLERIYQFMLAEAAKKSSDVNFPKLYPDAAKVLVVPKVVSGAFTKPGYEFMQQALANVQQYLSGETWVLGDQGGVQPDPKELEAQLRARYSNDFLKEWREFVRTASVARYAGLPDAAKKLSILASNSSPLLALFSVVSRNTAVEDKTIADAFQPPQFVVAPDAVDRYVGPSNQPYMSALTGLQTSVETLANAPTDVQAQSGTMGQATQAKVAARQIAQNFAVDAEGKSDANSQRLLEEPILNAEALIRGIGPAQMNGKGAGFCQVYGALWQKYPFSGNPANPPATIEDVNAVFQPGQGALWTFYQDTLAAVLVNQGGRYVPKPDSEIRVNPQFLGFFNNAAQLSNALYPGGSMTPALNYKLTAQPMEGVRAMDLTVSGTTLQASERGGQSRDFMWPGRTPYGVKLEGDLGGSPLGLYGKDGLWSIFDFLGNFDTWDANNNLSTTFRTGTGVVTVQGKPLTVRYQLDMKGAPPVFRKGYLSSLRCVPRVAQ